MTDASNQTASVVLHPKLARDAARLLAEPSLTRETIARIRRDLHMTEPQPKQGELDVCNG